MTPDGDAADEAAPSESQWVWSGRSTRESPIYFHDFCSLNPFDVVDEVPFMFDFASTGETDVAGGDVERDAADGDVERDAADGDVERDTADGDVERDTADGDVETDAAGSEEDAQARRGTRFQRATGRVLTYAVRHAPLLCIWVLLGLVVQSAVTDLVGVEYLPVAQSTALVVVFGLLVWGGIATLLSEIFYEAISHLDSRVESGLTLLRAGVIYGVLAVLVSGAAWAAYRVLVTPPGETAPSIVYTFGFLTLLYVGGPLVYDGMRRSENLFTRLPESDLLQGDDEDRYADDFLPRLRRAFRTDVRGVPAVLPLGVLFVAQFVWIWHVSAGPFGLDTWPTLVFVALVDVVIVVLAVQFVLLVGFLNELLRDDGRIAVRLQYLPGHEDDSGGYRDFGRFVTRVNTLLVLGGVYLAYRLHVQGGRDPLGPGGGGPLTEWDALLWTYSYAVPVVVYALVIVIWIYFSFWQLHRKMVRDKRRAVNEARPGDGRTMEDLTTLQTYRGAPEWPVSDHLLVTVVSVDVITVAISILTLL